MPNIQVLPLSPRQEQPSFSTLLAQQLGAGLGEGLSQSVQTYFQNKQQSALRDALEQAGVPAKIADIYPSLTEGGKTAALQKGLELGERAQGNLFDSFTEQQTPDSESAQFFEEIPLSKSSDTGLTLKERVTRGEGRIKNNQAAIDEAERKVFSLEKEKASLDQLENLNKSGKLPEGLELLNINWKTGEIRFPRLASPEAQLFSKTINDFATKAKDSFGARVTNFELDRFMKRLPTLINTEKGRELILRQMKLINELDTIHDSSLLHTFEKAGGSRNIDLDAAKRHAKKIRSKREKELIKEINGLVEESGKDFKEERPPLESFWR